MQRLADIRTGFAYFDLIFNVLPKTTPFDSSWCLYLLDWITRGSLNGWHWLEYHPLSDPRGIQILIIHTSTMVCILAVPASLLKARCFSQVARGGSKAKGGGASEAATQNIVGYEYIHLHGKKSIYVPDLSKHWRTQKQNNKTWWWWLLFVYLDSWLKAYFFGLYMVKKCYVPFALRPNNGWAYVSLLEQWLR